MRDEDIDDERSHGERESAADRPWVSPQDGLPLADASPHGWARVALADVTALLVDHAHCEQKAAASALSMIGRFADESVLVRPLLALAQEEMHHFRQVVDQIERRGARLTPPLPDRYVRALRERAFRLPSGLGALGDRLLCAAFVEARSCERFRLLAEALADPSIPVTDADRGLEIFYRRLASAEGRHWELFRDLAIATGRGRDVDRRIAQIAEAEAAIVRSMPPESRIH